MTEPYWPYQKLSNQLKQTTLKTEPYMLSLCKDLSPAVSSKEEKIQKMINAAYKDIAPQLNLPNP